ncbi:MAG: cytochrome c [Acidobacteria bacterium]|nr:cytochrome c [Acidobacteriota bacterium]
MTRICGLLTLVTLAWPVSAFAQHDKALVEHGEKVYAAQKCSVCHSIAGKGNPKGLLDDVGARLSADEIRMWIVDAPAMTAKTKAPRKPAMKAYANIPKDELEALVAYMQSLKKK